MTAQEVDYDRLAEAIAGVFALGLEGALRKIEENRIRSTTGAVIVPAWVPVALIGIDLVDKTPFPSWGAFTSGNQEYAVLGHDDVRDFLIMLATGKKVEAVR